MGAQRRPKECGRPDGKVFDDDRHGPGDRGAGRTSGPNCSEHATSGEKALASSIAERHQGAPIASVHRVPEQDVSATARIAAPADTLYALISDLTRMGEWSPENVGGRWLGSASSPAVGARFRGSNRRGWRRWSTTCRVVAADPGRTFAFDVSVAGILASRWSYEFRPDGDATMVTETWTDFRPTWFALLAGATMGIDDIRAHNQENIRATLGNLATAAERSR
jgi:Polyketide cyclase / dehydrase and lipid transport